MSIELVSSWSTVSDTSGMTESRRRRCWIVFCISISSERLIVDGSGVIVITADSVAGTNFPIVASSPVWSFKIITISIILPSSSSIGD